MRQAKILLTFFVVLVFVSSDASGQKPTVEKVKKVLTEDAGFSSSDLESLEKGNVIVKELDPNAEGEVAFVGSIKLDAPRDVVFSAFRRAVERQRAKLSKERGFFNKPAEVKDLTKLKIKNSAIRSLKNCKPRDCSWSLSSDYINRFKDDFDWDAADAEENATKLFKEIMVEHLNGYLEKGNGALMDYNDDPEPMSLSGEQESLLEGLIWINDFAPEFKEYLKEFPNGKLAGVEDLATWEKVTVAFKQVIINSHGIFYKKDDDEIPQGLIISKQVYANHFFHSSLSLTGIISFPKADDKFESYLLFVNHTRSGALTGTTGKLLSAAVDGEAENNLTTVLKDTRKYTAFELGNEDEPEFEEESGLLVRVLTSKLFIGIAILLASVIAITLLTRRGKKE